MKNIIIATRSSSRGHGSSEESSGPFLQSSDAALNGSSMETCKRSIRRGYQREYSDTQVSKGGWDGQ